MHRNFDRVRVEISGGRADDEPLVSNVWWIGGADDRARDRLVVRVEGEWIDAAIPANNIERMVSENIASEAFAIFTRLKFFFLIVRQALTGPCRSRSQKGAPMRNWPSGFK